LKGIFPRRQRGRLIRPPPRREVKNVFRAKVKRKDTGGIWTAQAEKSRLVQKEQNDARVLVGVIVGVSRGGGRKTGNRWFQRVGH